MPIAIHANCATGAGANVEARVAAKRQWIKGSGLWFLDDDAKGKGGATKPDPQNVVKETWKVSIA